MAGTIDVETLGENEIAALLKECFEHLMPARAFDVVVEDFLPTLNDGGLEQLSERVKEAREEFDRLTMYHDIGVGAEDEDAAGEAD